YIHLGKARDEWRQHPWLEPLFDAVVSGVQAAHGVATLEEVASALHRAFSGATDADTVQPQAEALVRLALEAGKDTLYLVHRRRDTIHWLAETAAHLDALDPLGDAADALADHDTLRAAEAARATLRAAAEDTALAGLPDARL